jgi:uncharacterized iron-regulated membrane protein
VWALVVRLHFYAGIFVAPVLVVGRLAAFLVLDLAAGAVRRFTALKEN